MLFGRDEMLNWQQVPDDVAAREWDQTILAAGDYAVFQSHGWGEFKRGLGWTPLRWVGRDQTGHVGAMVQFLLKRLPLGFGLAWAPGGPALQFQNDVLDEIDFPSLLSSMKRQFPRLLARFDSYVPLTTSAVAAMDQIFDRPSVPLSSGRSIQVDLSDGEAGFVAGMNSKHRYYLKKSNAAGLRWEVGADDRNISAFAAVHREMTESKNLKTPAMGERDYVALREALGVSGITIVTGYREDRPVTSCLTLDFGQKSFYFAAATNAEGRKVSAAYAMVARLISALQEKGIRQFDFGGVSPANPAARGVDHFKNGFGGQPVEYLGEWEWASVPLLGPAAGLLMRYRGIAA